MGLSDLSSDSPNGGKKTKKKSTRKSKKNKKPFADIYKETNGALGEPATVPKKWKTIAVVLAVLFTVVLLLFLFAVLYIALDWDWF